MTACLTARIEPLEPLMVRAPGGWFWMGCEEKKGVRDSARFDNGPGTFAFAGKQARLPVIGWVKLREELRFPGKAFSATVGRVADRWFVSVPGEVELPEPVRESQAGVGMDLGVNTAAKSCPARKRFMPLERLQRLSRWHGQKQGTSQTSAFMSSAAS